MHATSEPYNPEVKALLNDIRIATQQIAAGKRVPHRDAKRELRKRFAASRKRR